MHNVDNNSICCSIMVIKHIHVYEVLEMWSVPEEWAAFRRKWRKRHEKCQEIDIKMHMNSSVLVTAEGGACTLCWGHVGRHCGSLLSHPPVSAIWREGVGPHRQMHSMSRSVGWSKCCSFCKSGPVWLAGWSDFQTPGPVWSLHKDLASMISFIIFC